MPISSSVERAPQILFKLPRGILSQDNRPLQIFLDGQVRGTTFSDSEISH